MIVPIRAYQLIFIVSLIAILVLALQPPGDDPGLMINDKLAHGITFFALAVLMDRAFPGRPVVLVRFGVLLAYGALLEGLQSTTTYRDASWLDLLADAVGLLIYYGFTHAVLRWREESAP